MHQRRLSSNYLNPGIISALKAVLYAPTTIILNGKFNVDLIFDPSHYLIN